MSGFPAPRCCARSCDDSPAAAGLSFERRDGRGLDETLLAAAGDNADALPLLGFTLQFMFEHRAGELLTYAAYAELGGLEGAIGRAAEQAFPRLMVQGKVIPLLRPSANFVDITLAFEGKSCPYCFPLSRRNNDG